MGREKRNPGEGRSNRGHTTDKDYPLGYLVVYSNSRSGHNYIVNNIYSWMGDPLRLKRKYCNLEDVWPDEISSKLNFNRVNKNPESFKVIIVRDLLNWFASKVYLMGLENINIEVLTFNLQLWREISKSYFGDMDSIMDGRVLISYDNFVESENYRQRVCEMFGEKYNEVKLNYVPHSGGGSSFDGMSMNDKGSQMDVLNRYKSLEGIEVVKLLWDVPGVMDVYLDNFDVNDEKLEFLNRNK